MIRKLFIIALLCLIPTMVLADEAKTPAQLRGTGVAIGVTVGDITSVKMVFTQTLSERVILLSSGGMDIRGNFKGDMGTAFNIGKGTMLRYSYDLSKDVMTEVGWQDNYVGITKYHGLGENWGALFDIGAWLDGEAVVSAGLHFDL